MDDLKLIVLNNIKEFGKDVNNYLMDMNNSDSYILPIVEDRFNNGEAKVRIDATIRDKRGNLDIDKYLKSFDKSKFIIIDNFDYVDISSTELRKTLDSKYLNEKVVKYIKGKKLY